MKIQNLRDLLVEQLKDLYSAESQLLKALPKLAQNAIDPQLKRSFQQHLVETERQRDNLDQIFQILGESSGGHTCKAMKGIIEEAEDFIDDVDSDEVMDAGLIASAQRVEHYEIAGYGTVREYARELGEEKVASLLSKSLEQEKLNDIQLTQSAESGINQKADSQDRGPVRSPVYNTRYRRVRPTEF